MKLYFVGPALNPDAFSNFKSLVSVENDKHNADVQAATRWIEEELVVDFATYLDENAASTNSLGSSDAALGFDSENENEELISDMHLRGINVRYLGVVLRHVVDAAKRGLIISEMVARVSKHAILEAWRKIQSNETALYIEAHGAWMRDLRDHWKEPVVAYFQGTDEAALDAFSFDQYSRRIAERVAFLVGLVDGKIVPRVKHLKRITFEQGLSLAKMSALQGTLKEIFWLVAFLIIHLLLQNNHRLKSLCCCVHLNYFVSFGMTVVHSLIMPCV